MTYARHEAYILVVNSKINLKLKEMDHLLSSHFTSGKQDLEKLNNMYSLLQVAGW